MSTSFRHSSVGSMLMEFVLVMPLLFVLIMGVVQIAHIWTARMVVHYAAFCAARATLATNEAVCLLALGKRGPVYDAAWRVCAWITFTDGENGNDENEAEVPGWGKVPHSAKLTQRLTVWPRVGSPLDASDKTRWRDTRAPWLSGATVQFDFPLLIPVAGTMMGWLAHPGTTAQDREQADYQIGSGWTGQQEHGNYDGPYLTLTETVWLPRPYSISRYPISWEDFL